MKGFMTRHRPSPAMAVALLALGVALGGTSYAAITLPKNSVGTTQLKTKAVTGKKIATNAVTSRKVKDRSLLGVDFAVGQLPAGPKGDPGQPGATNVVIRLGPNASTPTASGRVFSVAACLPGERATGGGYTSAPIGSDDAVEVNRPASGLSGGSVADEAGRTPTQWSAQIFDTANNGAAVQAFVVCASP